jgi:hypothetical protein
MGLKGSGNADDAQASEPTDTSQPVPESATLGELSLGAGAIALWRRPQKIQPAQLSSTRPSSNGPRGETFTVRTLLLAELNRPAIALAPRNGSKAMDGLVASRKGRHRSRVVERTYK